MFDTQEEVMQVNRLAEALASLVKKKKMHTAKQLVSLIRFV